MSAELADAYPSVPAGPAEQAQWMLHRLAPGGVSNLTLLLRVDRRLRWWPLREALNHLVYRHTGLRATFSGEGRELRRRILPVGVEVPISTHDSPEETLGDVLADLLAEPFDVARGPLLRAHLVFVPGGSVVCLVVHHLIADHRALLVLRSEIALLYDAFAEHGEPPSHLADVVVPGDARRPPDPDDIEYWVRHLDGFDPGGMALSGARTIEGRPTFAGDVIAHELSASAVAAVNSAAREGRTTPNTVMLAAFYLLLHHHGAELDMVVGVPVTAGRDATPGSVGYHVSTLPVRVLLHPGGDVAGLLKTVGTSLLSGLEHADASYEDIAPSLTSGRCADWRVPTFRHVFNYRTALRGGVTGSAAPASALAMAGASVSTGLAPVRHSRVDLEWVVLPHWPDGGVTIQATYSTETHDRDYVGRLLDRYEAILSALAEDPRRPVRQVTGWTAADAAVVDRLNATRCGTPPGTVLDLIRAQGRRRPDAPALWSDEAITSHGELAAAAESVRAASVGLGVRAGDVVALLADRGPRLAAAVLGIWAAGAAYLPLDPAHPAARTADHLDDAGVRLVLADRPPGAGQAEGRDWLLLDDACAAERGPVGSSPAGPDPDSCAYLIYTSGSTGRPKGVEVSHRNLLNLVADLTRRLEVSATDRVLWSTTFAFDISALELLLPLAAGGTVVVAADAERMAPDRLLDLIAEQGVGVVQATPTTWRQVAQRLDGRLAGRRVLSGGEPLTAALAQRLLAAGCRLFNVYGPTETTIWSTAVELAGTVEDPVPLGGPIANTTVHVLDRHLREVPPGVRGELYIGGTGVAIGYRGRPDLTAERFVEVPGHGRLYRTGDEVRLTDDGLVFLGRLDRQMKVRGHRVEPAEVESVLESHPAVASAAVVTEPDSIGHLRLVAAVRPVASGAATADELRAHAAARLPSGAVPSRYVLLPDFPVNGSGKIDHRALSRRIRQEPDGRALPADPLLGRLTALWRETLSDPSLGPDADFFASGGHSLLAVALADRIAADLGLALGFETVFDAPTPARLRALLAAKP